MGNMQVNISNVGMANKTKSFEANSQPLETTTLGFNLDSSNDFSVPLRFGGADGPTVYLRPDQVDAMKMALASASRNEMMGDAGPSVSVTVNGRNYTMSASEMQTQLSGHGAITGGS